MNQFLNIMRCVKDNCKMTNSVNPDQTALSILKNPVLYINARDINLDGNEKTKILDVSSIDICFVSFF